MGAGPAASWQSLTAPPHCHCQTWTTILSYDIGGNDGLLSCPTSQDCFADLVTTGGPTLESSTNAGASWSPAYYPAAVNSLTSLTCPAPSVCYGLNYAQDLFVTTNSGASWRSVALPAGVSFLFGVSCWTAEDCMGTAGDAIITTTNGGASWTTSDTRDGPGTEVSCTSSTFCTGWGTTFLESTDDGVTWQSLPTPSGVAYFDDASCPSPDTCFGVGPTTAGGVAISSLSPAPTTTTLGALTTPVPYGTNETFEATVGASPGPPTGTVAFSVGSVHLCTATLSAGTATCTSALAPAGTDTVTARYSPTGQFGPSSGSASLVVTVAPPAAPAGSVSSQGASSVTNQPISATDGTLTVSGTGAGAFTVAQYGTDPKKDPFPGAYGTYYDVALGRGSGFPSITVTDCGLTRPASLEWWNGATWQAFSSQDAGAAGCRVATVTASTAPTLAQLTGTPIAPGPAPASGYRLVGSDGGIFSYGAAAYYGSTGGMHLNQPIVGMTATPDDKGYWLVASDGGIFSYGDARFYGSTGGMHLNRPIVGMTATPDGKGYWLVASDGGIFSYGDARFYGSTGNLTLNKPIVGMTPTPDGQGYWLVASDGGIFSYGDTQFYGSTGGIHLNEPIVAMAATPDAHGYWLVASDGGVFSYGDARYYGSGVANHGSSPVVDVLTTADGSGYWMVTAGGVVVACGDAPAFGSPAGHLNRPIVAMAH